MDSRQTSLRQTRLLSPAQAARILGVTPRNLVRYRARWTARGLVAIRLDRRSIRYEINNVWEVCHHLLRGARQ